MDPGKGWNDPPQSSTTSGSAAREKQGIKTTLNKRVPFPKEGLLLSSQTDRSTPLEDVSQKMPPADMTTLAASTRLQSSENQDSEVQIAATKTNLHQETLDILRQILAACLPFLEKKEIDEIEKRLAILSTMWNTDKIDHDVKVKMHSLAQALKAHKFDEANKMYVGLAVDRIGQVSPWIVGIKHLINKVHQQQTQKKVQEPIANS